MTRLYACQGLVGKNVGNDVQFFLFWRWYCSVRCGRRSRVLIPLVTIRCLLWDGQSGWTLSRLTFCLLFWRSAFYFLTLIFPAFDRIWTKYLAWIIGVRWKDFAVLKTRLCCRHLNHPPWQGESLSQKRKEFAETYSLKLWIGLFGTKRAFE